MRDENFKSEFKRSVKEEGGVEINDDQIKEIVKNFENTLQDKEALEEANLENVSGGAETPKLLRIGLGTLGFFACLSLGTKETLALSINSSDREKVKEYSKKLDELEKDTSILDEDRDKKEKALTREYRDVLMSVGKNGLKSFGVGLLSGAAGAVGGVKLADWIYKKYNERKNKAEFEIEDE